MVDNDFVHRFDGNRRGRFPDHPFQGRHRLGSSDELEPAGLNLDEIQAITSFDTKRSPYRGRDGDLALTGHGGNRHRKPLVELLFLILPLS